MINPMIRPVNREAYWIIFSAGAFAVALMLLAIGQSIACGAAALGGIVLFLVARRSR